MTPAPLLLVEGLNDRHVVQHLLRAHGLRLDSDFRIKDAGGDESLLTTLPVEIKAAGLTPLGVVIDADAAVQLRWDSLHYLLAKAGYKPPKLPESRGLILLQKNMPAVGVWVMPNNQLPGKLEDFVAQ